MYRVFEQYLWFSLDIISYTFVKHFRMSPKVYKDTQTLRRSSLTFSDFSLCLCILFQTPGLVRDPLLQLQVGYLHAGTVYSTHFTIDGWSESGMEYFVSEAKGERFCYKTQRPRVVRRSKSLDGPKNQEFTIYSLYVSLQYEITSLYKNILSFKWISFLLQSVFTLPQTNGRFTRKGTSG